MNTIVDMLRANAAARPCETALVEVNPERHENRHITWRDYDLVETTDEQPFRREMTWAVFDEKANRFANMLLSRGVKKGDKVVTKGAIQVKLASAANAIPAHNHNH